MDAEGAPAGDPGAGAGASGAAAGPPRADPAYIQMFLLKCGPCTACVHQALLITSLNERR